VGARGLCLFLKNAGFQVQKNKGLKLAVEAVIGEPVSALIPANREKYSEFWSLNVAH
jgi:hypothetical protein